LQGIYTVLPTRLLNVLISKNKYRHACSLQRINTGIAAHYQEGISARLRLVKISIGLLAPRPEICRGERPPKMNVLPNANPLIAD
jgi:hypothetical protein